MSPFLSVCRQSARAVRSGGTCVLLAIALWGAAVLGPSPQAYAQQRERGHPWIETYTADTYGNWRGDLKVSHRQNWDVTQGPDGIIYVANQDGLLSYDGTRWSALSVDASRPTAKEEALREPRSVFAVERLPTGHPDAGRILVGADGTFGVLRSDSLGRQVFTSLLPHLPPAERNRVGTVASISATSRAAYVRTAHRLYRWRGDSLHTWTPTNLDVPNRAPAEPGPEDARSFTSAFSVRDTLYVQVRGAGLFRADDDRLHYVSGSRRFANTPIAALLPHPTAGTHGLLVGTRTDGLFRLGADGRTASLDWSVEPWLRRHTLTHGARLPDGSYALATRQGGLLHVTASGRRLHALDTELGLQTNLVHRVFVDRAGSLWLALGNGLARVDASAPFTYYDEPLGLTAGVEALARHRGVLHACTRNGLHRLLSPPGQFARLAPIAGLDAPCHSLASTSAGLLVATATGVVVHQRGQQPYRVRPPGRPASYEATVLLQRFPGTAYVGSESGGVRRLRLRNERWTADPAFARATALSDISIQSLALEEDGTLWAAGPRGVVRIAAAATRAPSTTRYGPSNGLPVSSDGSVFAIDGTAYVGTAKGLHRFDAARPLSDRFVPDSTFGARWAQPGASVTHLLETREGGVWGRARETLSNGRSVITSLYQRSDGMEMRNSRPLVPFRDVIHGAVHAEGAVVWLGRRGLAPLSRLDFSGLLRRMASDVSPSASASGLGERPRPQIRRVTVDQNDSLLYGGAGAPPPIRVASDPGGLQVDYALPRFVLVATPVEYRTRLGPHRRWSAWSRTASADYAGLPPGRYQFQVQARLPGEPPSRIATLPFRVTPPWYRHPVALGLWGVLGLGLLAGLGAAGIRWRTRRLEKRQWRLEQTVAERTGALRSEKQKTERQAERLRKMDRLKSRFFTNVSHEFRTPLTLTIGPLEDLQAALRNENRPDSTHASLRSLAREKVDLALRNSRRLLRLIGQLLDIAKLEAGELRLTPQRADLAAFVRDRARAFAPLAERRQVRFAVEAPGASVPASFDPEKLGQVLTNLLSNAFKFTPPGGTIHVAVEHDATAGNARVTVRDSGPGIPDNEQAHLFERFYQSEETHVDGTPGTGIGLSLAKDLTELHGGTLTVESTVGIGTAFTVRLPVDAPAEATASASGPAPADAAPTTTLLVPGSNGTPDDRPDGTQAPSSPATPDQDDDRTTLLIADDNAEIRAYVRSHFENSYRILEAADGRAALEGARSALPDLIISDVMMPRLDGIALVEALRDNPETNFLPVILLTARATEDDKIEGLSEGADAYLTKPFNVRELQTRVEALIASRQRLKQHVAEASPPAVAAPAVDSAPDVLSTSEEQYLERVREAVRTHLSDADFGVEALAEAMGQSRSTLYRRLRDSIGETPTTVLRTLRLRHAAALLEEEQGTVSEVAYAVGFKSVSHFSQAFRDLYDVPPSAYLDEKSAS